MKKFLLTVALSVLMTGASVHGALSDDQIEGHLRNLKTYKSFSNFKKNNDSDFSNRIRILKDFAAEKNLSLDDMKSFKEILERKYGDADSEFGSHKLGAFGALEKIIDGQMVSKGTDERESSLLYDNRFGGVQNKLTFYVMGEKNWKNPDYGQKAEQYINEALDAISSAPNPAVKVVLEANLASALKSYEGYMNQKKNQTHDNPAPPAGGVVNPHAARFADAREWGWSAGIRSHHDYLPGLFNGAQLPPDIEKVKGLVTRATGKTWEELKKDASPIQDAWDYHSKGIWRSAGQEEPNEFVSVALGVAQDLLKTIKAGENKEEGGAEGGEGNTKEGKSSGDQNKTSGDQNKIDKREPIPFPKEPLFKKPKNPVKNDRLSYEEDLDEEDIDEEEYGTVDNDKIVKKLSHFSKKYLGRQQHKVLQKKLNEGELTIADLDEAFNMFDSKKFGDALVKDFNKILEIASDDPELEESMRESFDNFLKKVSGYSVVEESAKAVIDLIKDVVGDNDFFADYSDNVYTVETEFDAIFDDFNDSLDKLVTGNRVDKRKIDINGKKYRLEVEKKMTDLARVFQGIDAENRIKLGEDITAARKALKLERIKDEKAIKDPEKNRIVQEKRSQEKLENALFTKFLRGLPKQQKAQTGK